MFRHEGKMMILTATQVCMNQKIGKFYRHLRFYCGQHGKTPEKGFYHWWGEVNNVKNLTRAFYDTETINEYAGCDKDNFKFALSILQVDITEDAQKIGFKNWEDAHQEQLKGLECKSWDKNFKDSKISIVGYPKVNNYSERVDLFQYQVEGSYKDQKLECARIRNFEPFEGMSGAPVSLWDAE